MFLISHKFINNKTDLTFFNKNAKDLFDKILILKNNKKLQKNLGINAFNLRIKNFNTKQNAFLMIELYKKNPL